MNWTDKNIDKAFKESAEKVSFEYKDAYWTEMEAMLPRKITPDFFWFFTAVLFVGMMASLPFIGTDSSPLTTTPIANLKKSDNEAQLVVSNEIHEEIEQELGRSVENVDETKLEAVPNGNAKDFKTITPPIIKITRLKLAELPMIKNAIVDDNTGDNWHTRTSNFTKEEGVIDDANNLFNEQSLNTTYLSDAIQTNIDVVDFEKRGSDAVNENLEVDNLSTKHWSTINNELLAYEAYEPSLRSFFDFYAQALGGTSQSLTSPSEGISYSYGLGFGAQLHSGRFQLTTGVNALIFNHNDLNLNRTAKVYGFGADVYQYDINYKQIYSIEGVIEAGYRFGSHQFSVGVRPSFAYNSKVRLSETNLNWDESYVKERKTDDVYGYMDGINQFGLKGMLGYSFNIRPSLVFGINLGVQLVSPVNPDFITGQIKLLPIDGQLYIRKSFSFRK